MREQASRMEDIVKRYLPNRESAILSGSSYRLISRALLVLGGAGLLFLFPIGTIVGVLLILIGIVLL